MPGIDHLSIDGAVEEAGIAHALGIPAVLLFGLPAAKDEEGSGAWDDEGVIQLATRAIKAAHPDLLVITDLCLCEYTSHGHCGVLRADGVVDNDQTLELLARTAVSQAEAGADAVAPSDMMDGRVGALRAALDEHGLSETPIIAYSAKYASAFYGPFRDAADSAPQSGDRKGYQMDPANALEAVREAKLDVEEGADIVMVKPALPYLDIIRRVKDATGHARRRLQRQRRVRDDQGRRRAGPARRARRRARGADRHPPRRRRHRDHLPREGRRPMAQPVARAKVRSRRGRLGRPARRDRQEAPEPHAGLVRPATERRSRTSPGSPASAEDEVMERVQYLLDKRIIREITPIFDTRALGYSSMLVAAKVDAENPHRAAQFINSHPGVTHNYLRNHDFNLWFTLAVEPDSKLGLDGTLDVMAAKTGARVDPPAADAEAVQDPHGPRDGGRHRRAQDGRRGGRADGARPDRALRRRHRGDQGHPGPDGRCARTPTRPAAERLGVPVDEVLARLESLRERGGLRRVAAILYHRRAGFSANGMGVWAVPDGRDPRHRPADGRVPRHLALLPAPDLRGLAVLGLHDGPRALQGGVRRGARRDRRARPGISERATLYSSTEFKKVRMLYFTDDFKRWEAEHGS